MGRFGVRAGWRLTIWIVFFAFVVSALFVPYGISITHKLIPYPNSSDAKANQLFLVISQLVQAFAAVAATRLAWLAFGKDRDYRRFGTAPSQTAFRHALGGFALGISALLCAAALMVAGGWMVLTPKFAGDSISSGLFGLALFCLVGYGEEFLSRGYRLSP